MRLGEPFVRERGRVDVPHGLTSDAQRTADEGA